MLAEAPAKTGQRPFFGGSRWRKGRLRQAEFLGSVEGD